MAPDSAAWGHGRAAELVAELRGTVWQPTLEAALVGLLDGDLKAIWLATALSPLGTLPPLALLRALESAERYVAGLGGVDPGAEQMVEIVRSHWYHAVAVGLLPFLPAYRQRITEPGAAVLLGAALVWDHTETMARLDELLGEGDNGLMRFGLAVRAALRRSEAEALRLKLAARQRAAPTALRGRCIEALTYYLDRDILPDAGPVRWQRR